MEKSLFSKHSPLAAPAEQLRMLGSGALSQLPRFEDKLRDSGLKPFKPVAPEIFQINLGKMCNQACRHCHVDAGPDRKEVMSESTMKIVLAALARSTAPTVDLTGGAPELNPKFRWFVDEILKLERKIMVRCNLTIILSNPRFYDLPEFFRLRKIHVVSSLPFYQKQRTDRQRGVGVFEKSIEALKRLNAIGYGLQDSGLLLDLVYNPAGAFLPSSQSALEKEFKTQLKDQFGIQFNNLFAITNMPISRYLEYLIESGNLETYMEKLVSLFNPKAASGAMCRNTISIGWDGRLFDCDFNQMLDLSTNGLHHVADYDQEVLMRREIVVNQHCYGCTAGSGSSCGGSITE